MIWAMTAGERSSQCLLWSVARDGYGVGVELWANIGRSHLIFTPMIHFPCHPDPIHLLSYAPI